jgi:GNAT superfamily N-acetyltransferase
MNTGATVGELAWSWGTAGGVDAAPWRVRRWFDGDESIAWGGISAPEMIRVAVDRWEMSATTLDWQIHPDHGNLLDEVLEWFDDSAAGAQRCTSARVADHASIEVLGRNGYRLDPTAPWFELNTCAVRGLGKPVVPEGFRLRTALDVEPAAAVAVERAAWSPSKFTLDSLLRVRSTWPYRDELAVFVEAPDGTLVASALVWYDDINHTAELEPVGTHPDHRQLGLGRAVSLFGLLQAREVGATEAIVNCRGDENYPIPRHMYHSLGFIELTRDLVFVK